MTPQSPWKIDSNNTPNNTIIGDGTAGQPKDNARQAFELIQTINKLSQSKQITSFHFDHEVVVNIKMIITMEAPMAIRSAPAI
jgi:hypothetical protein